MFIIFIISAILSQEPTSPALLPATSPLPAHPSLPPSPVLLQTPHGTLLMQHPMAAQPAPIPGYQPVDLIPPQTIIAPPRPPVYSQVREQSNEITLFCQQLVVHANPYWLAQEFFEILLAIRRQDCSKANKESNFAFWVCIVGTPVHLSIQSLLENPALCASDKPAFALLHFCF